MTAFGPATESSTYILMAVPFASALLAAWNRSGPRWVRHVEMAGAALLVATAVAVIFPSGKLFGSYGQQPLGALLIAAGAVGRIYVRRRAEPPSGMAGAAAELTERAA